MNELLKGILGESKLSKFLPIIIIVVLLIVMYFLRKTGSGVLDMLLKGIDIPALLEGI